MSFIEFVGFMISMAFLFFLFFQRKWELYQRRKNPEKYEAQRRKKDEDLKTLLASMGLEVKNEDQDDEEEEEYLEEEEDEGPLPVVSRPVTPPPSPHPRTQRIVNDAYAIKTTVEQRRMMTAVEQRELPSRLGATYKGYTGADVVSTEMRSRSDAYVIRKGSSHSRGYALMKNLSSRQEMVFYREIFDQPRSLRGWDK